MAKSSKLRNLWENEDGNVLFLILVAAALFATLSYAVTKSSRGGALNNDNTSTIDSTPLIQNSTAIRTAIMRMGINRIERDRVEFNTPEDFAGCSNNFERCVFHPNGGEAIYMQPPATVMADGTPGTWIFNGENEVNYMGSSTGNDSSSANTADIIAFLPGISENVCRKINEEYEIDFIPEEVGIDYSSATMMINPDGLTETSTNGTGATIGSPTGTDVSVFDGALFGCFEQAGEYVFYHLLVEQ